MACHVGGSVRVTEQRLSSAPGDGPSWGGILSLMVYIAALQYSYAAFVVPNFEYWGFGDTHVPAVRTATSWILALLPALFLRRRIERPSEFLVLLQYLIIYVPTLFLLEKSVNPELGAGESTRLAFALAAGMLVLVAGTRLRPLKLRRIELPQQLFWYGFTALGLGLIGYLAGTLGGGFRLAGLEEMYEVREATASTIEEAGLGLAGYALMWLGGFVLPLAFALAVTRAHPFLLLPVAAGYVFAFGLGGSKQTLFAIVYLGGIYIWTRIAPHRRTVWLALGLSVMLLVPAALQVAGPIGELVGRWYTLIVNVRIFSIPQLSIAQYFDFFSGNPLTYGSHIKGISAFVAYPYASDIPYTVGEYYYGRPIGANVGMWAQDGIAAFGLPGVLIVSVVAALVFWLLDSVAVGLDRNLVIVSLGVIATTLTNVSLFTSLVSGGLAIAIATLWLLPRQGTAVPRQP